MKVKNVAFSGVAAAMMLSAGIGAAAAAAAAPQIASKQYVDNKVATDVQTLQTTIENNYTKTEKFIVPALWGCPVPEGEAANPGGLFS